MVPFLIPMWVIISIVIGIIGSNKTIGFFGAFLLSLILSPLIGLIVVIASTDKALLKSAVPQPIVSYQTNQKKVSIADEIEKLKKLRDQNMISEEEFTAAKAKLINNI